MQAKTRGLDPGTEGKKLRKGDTHKGRGDGDTDKTTDTRGISHTGNHELEI